MLAVLLLSSCRKEEAQRTISFASPKVETKTVHQAIQGTDYPQAEYLSVVVAHSASDWEDGNAAPALTAFMGKTGAGGTTDPYGVSCGYNPGIGASGAWDPESGISTYGGGRAYYWEDVSSNKLQTQAYSPSGAHLDMSSFAHSWADGFTFTGFTTPAVGSQYDLLYSDRTFNRTQAGGSVDLAFRHALSSVVIRAALHTQTFDEVTLHLTGMTLGNVYRTGTFSQGLKTVRDDADPYQSGYPAWAIDYTSEYSFSGFIPEGDLQFAAFGSSTGWLTSNEALLLIPQTLDAASRTAAAGGTEPDLTLTVNFTITAADGSSSAQTITLSNPGDLPEWEAGKQYTYTVFFDPKFLNVSVRVIDWTEQAVPIE